MRQIIIQIDGNEIQVIESGCTSGPLGFDEMLGQIVSLVPRRLQSRTEGPRYDMLTPEQWVERDERIKRAARENSHEQHP